MRSEIVRESWFFGMQMLFPGLKGNPVRLQARPELPPQLYAANRYPTNATVARYATGRQDKGEDLRARRPATTI